MSVKEFKRFSDGASFTSTAFLASYSTYLASVEQHNSQMENEQDYIIPIDYQTYVQQTFDWTFDDELEDEYQNAKDEGFTSNQEKYLAYRDYI